MGVFCAIVQTLVRSMLDARHDLPARHGIGAKLVGDYALWATALLVKKAFQQSLSRFGVTANLQDFVENISVLIDSAPEIALFTVDRDNDFVEMPNVATTGLFAFQTMGVIGTEFLGPATDGFVGEIDPPFEEHFLDQAQAEWESEIEPDGMGDDLRREAMALVAHGRRSHGLRIGPLALPAR
ncbi:hypothetical protein A1351_12260 [Methylosinus sp. R-45379]|nr:hypothetical protein A1351_12260 [Methylosinus sp. R-45379]